VPRLRRLLLVRHGLPDYRFRGAYDEPPGAPLSEVGRVQIGQTPPILKRHSPTTVHSSPLARALQSAEIVGHTLGLPVKVHSDLKEWHRTERLYQVTERSARWLRRWLADDEPCAVVVGHASPLLAIIRTALYLPHFGWWRADDPDDLVVGTCDRFEISMGSVFELAFEPQYVTARCLFHPEPRILGPRHGRPIRNAPRGTIGGENRYLRRPNFARLIGCPT
jgi:broad specificity phosphatase PhoE